tara:strand:- start:644 stop:946 length:303 start_codon:yes stop_codon:yes gene_type:complete
VTEYEVEAARRASEASQALRKEVKDSGWVKEAKARKEAVRLLGRWSEGAEVEDKRTGHRFIYQGNVNEPDGLRYRMKIICPFGNPSVSFSMIPHAKIVRV